MRVAGGACGPGREAADERHHEMPASHERFLVCRGDDLARLERGEDGPQGYETAGRNHDEVHVGDAEGGGGEEEWDEALDDDLED